MSDENEQKEENKEDYGAALLRVDPSASPARTETLPDTGIPRIPNVWENARIAAGGLPRTEHPWIKRGPYPGPEHTGIPIPADPIVGHKTFRDGHHEPLRQSEAEVIIAASDRAKALRAERMPDERAAIDTLFSAWLRLKELGWQEAMYCPKDGSWFSAIEAGSTWVHRTKYQGEWPTGTYWISDDSDLWPSRPILWKPLAGTQGATSGIASSAASSAQESSSLIPDSSSPSQRSPQ